MKKWVAILFVLSVLSVFPVFAEDEFKSVDEFSEFKSEPTTTHTAEENCNGGCALTKNEEVAFRWVLGILAMTVLAGVLVRFKTMRNFRALFLVASIVVLGFYKGACPCPIQSMQNFVFGLFGHGYKWQTMLYFLALLPITYIFGRVFCGWICHLGALQEFLFMGSRFRYLQTEKMQKWMRVIRVIALVALLIQITITQTTLYKKVDPFAIVFNFHSLYIAGWVLVVILIISSVLLYRPFCKTICPIGLILGWVSKMPGASVLGVNESCVSCSNCNSNCLINAITHDNKISKLDNQECIRCGDCMDACRKDSITFYFKGKSHGAQTDCKKCEHI